MRQIKFRFYDPVEKQMMTSGMEVDYTGNLCVFMGENECPIMQFTGLLDKNGKEIYEGDIVKYSEGALWAVRYNEQKARYEVYDPIYTENQATFTLHSLKNKPVIGNIYENPELLN